MGEALGEHRDNRAAKASSRVNCRGCRSGAAPAQPPREDSRPETASAGTMGPVVRQAGVAKPDCASGGRASGARAQSPRSATVVGILGQEPCQQCGGSGGGTAARASRARSARGFGLTRPPTCSRTPRARDHLGRHAQRRWRCARSRRAINLLGRHGAACRGWAMHRHTGRAWWGVGDGDEGPPVGPNVDRPKSRSLGRAADPAAADKEGCCGPPCRGAPGRRGARRQDGHLRRRSDGLRNGHGPTPAARPASRPPALHHSSARDCAESAAGRRFVQRAVWGMFQRRTARASRRTAREAAGVARLSGRILTATGGPARVPRGDLSHAARAEGAGIS